MIAMFAFFFANIAPEICKFAFQNHNKGEKMWWVLPFIPLGWKLLDEFDKARERNRKKRKKKERRRAEAERQRQIALQRQAEEEKQRQIEREMQRQIELEKQRQGEMERKRQEISALIEFFASESLRELTLERLENAEYDWEELCAIEEEARCARNIESNANVLPTSPYCEEIKQRLFDAYSARDIEELQALMEESEQIQDLKHIKSCSLLRPLINERIANADTIEELQRIAEEVSYIYTIEQCYQKLAYQGYLYQKLEDAYRNRDIKELQVFAEESEQFQKLVQSIKSYPLSTTLRQLTDKRVVKAGIDMEELRKIEREALCARTFEQCYQYLVRHGHTYIELENAYRNRDFGTLWALRTEAKRLQSFYEKPISPQDDGASVVFGD